MGLVISLETGESPWPSIRSEAIFALLRFVVSLASPFGPRSLLLLPFPTILPLLTRAKPRPFSVSLPPFQNEPDCRCLVPCCADLYLSVSLSLSLPPSLPSSLSLSVSSGADTTYGLLVASCSLFFEKTDPLITCNHIFSLARASSKNG